MLFRPTRRELREENERLTAGLDQARALLSRYRDREQDLIEVLLRARADSRQAVEDARSQALQIVEDAREESRRLLRDARAAVDAAERDLAQIRALQPEIEAALRDRARALTPMLQAADDAREVPRSLPEGLAHPQPAYLRATAGGAAERAPTAPAVPGPASLVASVSVRDPSGVSGAPELPGVTDTERRELSGPALDSGPRPAVFSSPGSEALAPARLRPAHVTVGLLILLAAVALGWKIWGGRATSGSSERAMVAGALGSAAPGVAGAKGGEVPATPTAVRAEPSAPSADGPLPESPAPTAASGTGGREGSDAPTAAGPVAGNTFVVAIEATRPAWVRAIVDGRRALARTIEPGEHVDFRAARDVVVRAGDAGAVLVGVDGRTMTALGRNGAVVTTRIAASQPPRPSVTTAAVPAATRAGAIPQAAPASLPSSDSAASAGTRAPDGATSPAAVTGGSPPGGQPPPGLSPETTATAASTPPAGAAPPGPSGSAADAVPSVGLTSVEQQVIRAHQDYFDALHRDDQGAMRRLQGRNFAGSGTPPPGSALRVLNVSVQVSGVGAVVSGTASREAVGPDGRETTQPLMFSEIWTNLDGSWQLISVRFTDATSR